MQGTAGDFNKEETGGVSEGLLLMTQDISLVKERTAECLLKAQGRLAVF